MPQQSWTQRIHPVWLILIAIVSVQIGAATAKGLFDRVDPLSITWLRLVVAAAVLLVIARPKIVARNRRDWALLLGYSACLVIMNVAIYQSFARIPLGIAVTIEFLGPLAVALAGSRRLRDLVWIALAGVGVALLGWSPGTLDPVGVGFAVLAAAAWAGYILLAGPTGKRWSGSTAVTMASLFGAIALAVPALIIDHNGLWDPTVLVLAASVGVLSSVLPYSLEIAALRRMSPSVFGILMSLEPAAAALAALLMLGEFLTVFEWVAVVCVVIASGGATRSVRRGAKTAAEKSVGQREPER